jgi:hypothetical protein
MPSTKRKVSADWQGRPERPQRLRQKRFPNRRSTQVLRAPSYEPPSHQTTLTQVQFVTPTPSFEVVDNDDDDELSDESELEGSRLNKRRKVATKKSKKKKQSQEELRRQSTLTQLQFFVGASSDYDEEGLQAAYNSDEVPDFEDPVRVKGEEEAVIDNSEIEDGDGDEQLGSINMAETQYNQPTQLHQLIRGYDPADRDWEGYEDGMEITTMFKQEVVSPKSTPARSPVRQVPVPTVFITPRKPNKHEIPSSQSPAATPITMSQVSRHRTPLRELNLNTVSSRDNIDPASRRTSMLPEDDEHHDEAENIDPEDGFIKLAESQDRSHILPSPSPSPTKRLSQRFTTAETEHVFIRPLPRASIINDSQAETQMTEYYTPSSSPQRDQKIRSSQATTVDLTQRSIRHETPLPPHTSRSQATTVDLTQPSVHRATRTLIPSSPLPGLTSAPSDRRSSQSPPDMFLQRHFPSSLPGQDFDTMLPFDTQFLGTCEPMSDVQNSADIKTVSQLVGSMLWSSHSESEEL